MGRADQPKLGELELRILNVLWERGEATVREVLEALPAGKRPAYTTVLTVMRLMHEKGYLTRRERGRAHIYQARLRETPIKRGMLRHLIEAAFRGSREALLVRLFEDENLSEEELRRVHELLAQHGRGGRR
jgi:predicted transcriptional regulator